MDDPTAAVLSRLGEIFGPDAIADRIGEKLPGVLTAGLSLLVFYLLWRMVDRVIQTVLTRAHMDLTAVTFIRTLLRFTLGIVAGLTALDQLGVDTTSILTSLGVVGLTLGFAAQDTLSNVISGLFIFWDRPFVIGDLVELDGEYGKVEQITLRSTRLVTPDGRMFAIPNKIAAGVKVASYTNFPHLRLDVDVTVGVNEDLGKVRRTLLATVTDNPDFMADPAPVVIVTALNDYNVAVQLRAWLDDERKHVAARANLRETCFEALRSAGVDMPYETLQIQPLTLKREAG